MSVESWLCVECLLAAFHGTLEPLRLAVDGLDVHQEIVAHTKSTSALFALEGEEGREREGGVDGREREREREN